MFLRLWEARQRVAMDFPGDVVVAWSGRAAMEPDPDAQQRIGEAVTFLAGRNEVDVFEPRQIVLGRAGRALQTLRNLGQRQPFVFREDFEDRFEGAVPPGAMQPKLVAEAAVFGQT